MMERILVLPEPLFPISNTYSIRKKIDWFGWIELFGQNMISNATRKYLLITFFFMFIAFLHQFYLRKEKKIITEFKFYSKWSLLASDLVLKQIYHNFLKNIKSLSRRKKETILFFGNNTQMFDRWLFYIAFLYHIVKSSNYYLKSWIQMALPIISSR